MKSLISAIKEKINPKDHTMGAKIHKIRITRSVSTRELGKSCGVNDMSIRNYEGGKRQPADQRIKDMADYLHVNPAALYDRRIESYEDVMHILFEIEMDYKVSPCALPNYPFYGIVSKDEVLIEAIKKWCERREAWENQQISSEEYTDWKNDFPESMGQAVIGEPLNIPEQYSELERRIHTRQMLEQFYFIINDYAEMIANSMNAKDTQTAMYQLNNLTSTMKNLINMEIKKLG